MNGKFLKLILPGLYITVVTAVKINNIINDHIIKSPPNILSPKFVIPSLSIGTSKEIGG